eukprot:TRINITY_DN2728_c0_g1_i1.p1 TRINITY_DN2728_c0_g1~~TRINITY_DN2728_c0_g1_i1.p1  ORF type:complete len:600 (+),score=121.44 TRINITY_DN2728_c0_g1_i1:411-2210(+)
MSTEEDTLNTPLHFLAKGSNEVSTEVIELLKDKGIDINCKNAEGFTPLHGAASIGNERTISALIKCGANMDILNNEGETALNWATRNNHRRAISVLLREYSKKRTISSINVNRVDSNSDRQIPVRRGTVRLLKGKLGSDPNLEYDNPLDNNEPVDVIQSSSSSPLIQRGGYDSYELTFFGNNFKLCLNDENWDTVLYEGGVALSIRNNEHKLEGNRFRRDTLANTPLSNLFNLYLTISGKPKTDPEILEWIVKYLTGVKQKYLQHLYENYMYRIRVLKDTPKSPKSIFTLKNRETFSGSDNIELDEMVLSFSGDESKSLFFQRRQANPGKRFHWEIDESEIEIITKISKGSFGTVFKSLWYGTCVALKVLEHDVDNNNYGIFIDEINMMSTLRHPNIIQFLGGCIETPHLFIITEYAERGNLLQVLEEERENEMIIEWNTKMKMCIDLAQGLLYLHSQDVPILHRDLKSPNVLVMYNYSLKLGDFGLSKQKTTDLNTKLGTLNWVAPEILNDNTIPYSEAADVYSFAVVLWEIITSEVPYGGKSPLQVVRMIDMGEHLKIPKYIDERFQTLIASCWNTNPRTRPTIGVALETLRDINNS